MVKEILRIRLIEFELNIFIRKILSAIASVDGTTWCLKKQGKAFVMQL